MYLTRRSEDAMLRISLGPEYSYRLAIRRAGVVDRIACSVRDRWPTIYPIVVSLCLLGIATRLDTSPHIITMTFGSCLLVAMILDILIETLVALGLLHVVAVTACLLIIFSGTITHNVTTRFLARIVSIPSLWFDWLLGGFYRIPILMTMFLLTLASATCGAIAVLLSVPLHFLKLTKMYEDYLEELFMSSLRQFIPRFGRGKRKRKRRETSATDVSAVDKVNTLNEENTSIADVSTESKISRGILLNHLLLFVTWSFVVIPAIPSAIVWAKNFRYETRLTTEDSTMLFSWLLLISWGSSGLVEIPHKEPRSCTNRQVFCANVIRLLACAIVFLTTIEKAAFYQWIVPPLVALAVTCLALLSLFPGNDGQDRSQTGED